MASIVIPMDMEKLVLCAVAATAFEVMRMLIAYFLARPSPQIDRLESDKIELQLELAKIKSVQLEFVKHSLLQRKVIAVEKKIETLQAIYSPRLLSVRRMFRILRVILYLAVGVYFWDTTLILINPMILWPASWFVYSETMSVPAWLIMFTLGGSVRHILRSALPLIFSTTTFP